MNILDEIIAFKNRETETRKKETPISVLRKNPLYHRKGHSLVKALTDGNTEGIIAEFKRKSPSKGIINANVLVEEATAGYEKYGAAGISVLTEEQFFGGSLNDLATARKTVNCPLLRKDFITDEYQLEEAKAMGADIILLIAAALTPRRVKELAKTAINLGLEVLLELHEEAEMEHICDEAQLVGINNRNLKTFVVDIENSLLLAEKIPAEKIKIAESGIDAPETINLFRQNGFSGFLMGEYFMKQQQPATAFEQFIKQLKNIYEH
jgi:indole-3-glycerol phosphate synthase